jgi:hypothetical protein
MTPRSWRIRQKYFIVLGKLRQKIFSVHGDKVDFKVVLFIPSRLRIRQKYFSLYGEYALGI